MVVRRAAVFAAALTAAAYAAWSQAPAPARAKQEPAPTKSTTRTLKIDFESIDYTDADGGGSGTMTKFRWQDGDTEFRGDRIRVNEKDKVAVATGNIHVDDPQANVTGEKATIYYAKARRLVVLTGSVHILLKPKKGQEEPVAPAPVKVENGKAVVQEPAKEDESAQSARKHPTELTCDRVEYEYAKTRKHAQLTGTFKAVQKLKDNTRTLTADKAEYFGTDDRVDLMPPVHYEDTKGNVSDNAHLVKLWTKEGEERVSMGPGTMTIKVEDESDEEETPAAKPAGKPGPKPADTGPAKDAAKDVPRTPAQPTNQPATAPPIGK